METHSDSGLQSATAAGSRKDPHETGWSRHNRKRHRIYMGMLIFVVLAGLPMIGIPSLRYRLRTRIQGLRAAYAGMPAAQAPAAATVGESREPFPRAYQHQAPLPAYLPEVAPRAPRTPLRITPGGEAAPASQAAGKPQAAAPRPARASGTGSEPKLIVPSSATATAEPAAADAGSEPQFRKGKSEQEAYDLLAHANQTLAGMVQGSDPTLKFQDWSAAAMGENSYYVMVTFVQTADQVVRKYIWNVKVATKEVVPLSAYAMSISK